MRTLFEIIEAVKNNETVTEDEMRYSICAMDALMVFDRESFMTLVKGEEKGKNKFIYSPKFQLTERFERIKSALNKNPKEWLGENYDFKNPEYQKRRKSINRIFETLIDGEKSECCVCGTETGNRCPYTDRFICQNCVDEIGRLQRVR
jgi:hypothetical protein